MIMAKYTINTKQMDKNYPYNIISIDSYVDGKYIEICYTLGIPNTVLYGKTETIEIYYYKTNNKGDGHYKSHCFSTHNGKLDKVPNKYLKLIHQLKDEYKNVFGIKYTGSSGI